MCVSISIWLHYKPLASFDMEGQELEKDFTKKLRAYGKDLNLRMQSISDILDKLFKAGWNISGGLYDVYLTCDNLHTNEDAKEALLKAGISLDEMELIDINDMELCDNIEAE